MSKDTKYHIWEDWGLVLDIRYVSLNKLRGDKRDILFLSSLGGFIDFRSVLCAFRFLLFLCGAVTRVYQFHKSCKVNISRTYKAEANLLFQLSWKWEHWIISLVLFLTLHIETFMPRLVISYFINTRKPQTVRCNKHLKETAELYIKYSMSIISDKSALQDTKLNFKKNIRAN